jgi:hypothetical protein
LLAARRGFDGGASASTSTATFGDFELVTAASAASSIAVPDFNAMSVQMLNGLNRRKGFADLGSIYRPLVN